MTRIQDITLTKRDTYSMPVIITMGGGLTLADFPESKLLFTAKRSYNDTDENAAIGPLELDITDAVNNTAELNLTTEDTDIQLGTYYYDIQFYNEDPKIVKTTVKGKCDIAWDVTIKDEDDE